MLLGVYRPVDPLRSIPRERIQALVQEAYNQRVRLLFFGPQGIDFEQEQIQGMCYEDDGWKEITQPFPQVVINEWPVIPKNRPPEEQRLRERIPFTSYLIHDKYEIYQMMEKHGQFKHLLIPSKPVRTWEDVREELRVNHRIVLKPTHGRQGRGIYFLSEGEEVVRVHSHLESTLMTCEELKTFLEKEDLLKSDSYISQPYIPSLTPDGEPFDFRVHVQRGSDGQWKVTKIYPRIGPFGSILSNLSRGGKTEPLDIFLKRTFPHSYPFMEGYLQKLSLDLADHINSFYQFKIDELGIDLTIDQFQRTWLYEFNTGPQTRFHEQERAKNTLAYACYVAREHSIKKLQPKLKIGMLTGVVEHTNLKFACVCVAKMHDVEFFYFTPQDLSPDRDTLKGSFLIEGEWVQKETTFPDVIYDRFRKRGLARFQELYQRLAHIPFTNDRQGGSVSKLEVYHRIKHSGLLTQHLIPFESVESVQQVCRFLKEHQRVIMKPSLGSFGKNLFFLQIDGERVRLREKDQERILDRDQLFTFLSTLVGKRYVVQRYIESKTKDQQPFHLRVHTLKNGKGKWSIAAVLPNVAQVGSIATNHEDTLRNYCKWEWFLSSQYPGKGHQISQEVYRFALQFSELLQHLYVKNFHEIGIDIGIDEHHHIWLFEANVNLIGTSFHELEVAEHVIPYAIYRFHEMKKESVLV